jgi:hypothetical protein
MPQQVDPESADQDEAERHLHKRDGGESKHSLARPNACGCRCGYAPASAL